MGPYLHLVQFRVRAYNGVVLDRQKELVGRPHHWIFENTMPSESPDDLGVVGGH